MDVTTAILSLLAGIGVFLIACTMLSSNLESICSNRLRNLFARASDKKLVGVGIGTVSTAAIQSSGATTVLVIGFVNAGIMSLTLAAAVIYGANIGTTVTAQIVAWGMMGDGLSLTTIFGAMAGIGAFVAAYAKKDKTKKIGGVIAGFGLLFVGLKLMEAAMGDFAEMEEVKDFLSDIKNIILLVLLGAALTAVVQSSSVMTTIIITMLVAGLIDLEQGIYLTMGSNIGSCVVAIMAGFTSGLNARRTAMIHLLFNVIGVCIFVAFGAAMGFATGGDLTYGSLFEGISDKEGIQLAMFHTVFNVITVIIMLPLTGLLIKAVMRIVPDKKDDRNSDDPHLYFVDEHMLKTPAIAIGEVKNEIVNMADLAMNNFKRSCRIVTTLNMEEKEDFDRVEDQIDYTNFALSHYLIKLSNKPLNSADLDYVSTAFHTITDLERIGDYAENIVEYAVKLKSMDKQFSESAIEEIDELETIINNLYKNIMKAYKDLDDRALEIAYDIEEQVDTRTAEMADNHIQRLGDGQCEPSIGAEFLSLTSDAERIADHFINVGKTIREIKKSKQHQAVPKNKN